MRYLLLYLILIIQLLANEDLLDIYQKEGSEGVEKVFDTALSTYQYWENKLRDIDTRFGYFEGINYLLACDKNATTLKLYTKDTNNTFELNKDFSAFVGKKKGDKQKEGDLKTPVGVYQLIQKLEHVDPFYGPLAFVTSYPNTYDKVQGKNGSGIWVHGLPLDQKRDDYTKGCIAINNNNLQDIESQIDFKEALVYIDQKPYPEVSKKILMQLLSQLYSWRKAWKTNDFETYMSFYDKDFKRIDGLDYTSFKDYKERIFKKDEYKQILFSDINILPYPMQEHKDVYLISFREEYSSSSFKFSGHKELYVHMHSDKFYILAEK